MTWGYSGRRLDESQKGDEGSTHCIMDSIQKLAQELRGTLHMHIPPTGLWAHPVLGMPHTCTPTSYGQLLVHALSGNKSELSQLASEHTQKARLKMDAKERLQAWTSVPL